MHSNVYENLNEKVTDFTSVCYHERDDRWISVVKFRGDSLCLGSYKNKDDAIACCKEGQRKYYKKSISVVKDKK